MNNTPAVRVETAVCVACEACVDSCPTDVFHAGQDGKAIVEYPEDCQFCFLCVFDCPVDAVRIAIPPLGELPRWWSHWSSYEQPATAARK
jgi:NAD-dependent dihydropyrimidine dehydrogenase PreA subunit